MAVDDFDTSRMRQCMECHRSDFDDGDWQFVGYDDLAELYICPDCVALARDYSDNSQDPPARTPHDAETPIPAAICASCVHFKTECRGIQNGCEDWTPLP